MIETTLEVGDSGTLLAVFGTHDQHIKRIRKALGVKVSQRDGQIRIQGDETAVDRASELIQQLSTLAGERGAVTSEDVSRRLEQIVPSSELADQTASEALDAGRKVEARSPGQAAYIRAMRTHDLVFCNGPAGTGKTYLAVAMALQLLRADRVRKIVLVRPAVEAGESLGFLPGDLQAKINPYLRPLLDALHDLLDHEQYRRYLELEMVEVLPLAYMRGRTLNEAFIILDEAQNTTISQMKMFLTRMGQGSKIVVAGDTTQIDLPAHQASGMIDALDRLKQIKDFAHVALTGRDIVRHRLVQAIVEAYDQTSEKRTH